MPRDAGAHCRQAVGQVGDLGFARGVADDGFAGRQDGGEQQVLGGAHGWLGQHDLGAAQAVRGGGVDQSAVQFDLGAHGAQAGDMEVDAAQADRVAAGKRQACLAAAGQQGAEQEDGGAHAGDQVAVDLARVDAVGADRERQAGRSGRPVQAGAESLQQVGQDGDVQAGGHVVQRDGVRRQQGRNHQRQDGVFRAADRVGCRRAAGRPGSRGRFRGWGATRVRPREGRRRIDGSYDRPLRFQFDLSEGGGRAATTLEADSCG